MTHNSSAQEYAARLLHTLDAPDELRCSQAQALLPAFVEAERSGEDVDADPTFALLLRHLDRCADCIELYAGLAEDLAALMDQADVLPQVRATPPEFFRPARQTEQLTLRILTGLKRHFELTLQLPSLAPRVAALKDNRRINLFSDSLPELPGTPLLAIALNLTDQGAELTVAIREASTAARWEIRLTAPGMERTAITNDRGTVRFSQLPVSSLNELTLHCSELGSEPINE